MSPQWSEPHHNYDDISIEQRKKPNKKKNKQKIKFAIFVGLPMNRWENEAEITCHEKSLF